jgi:hypothetical protein
MGNWIPIFISLAALAVSVSTAWLTFFRSDQLRMTQPTVIFFEPDGGIERGKRRRLKVFLRTLLYSTARRGQVVESLHVNLHRGESRQNFSIWVYGQPDDLAREWVFSSRWKGSRATITSCVPTTGPSASFLMATILCRFM